MTSNYTYDNTNILREVRGSATLKYVHGLGVDEHLAVDDATALSFFHADALGSVVRMTNASGAVTLARQYDAWGNPSVGANDPGFSFTGREWDPEAGLYYYRSRYYDPSVGRFLGEDPIDHKDGGNKYPYVLDNPANRVDPDGEEASEPALCGGKCPHSVFTAFFNICEMAPRMKNPQIRDCVERKCKPKAVRITCDSSSCPGSGQPGYTPARDSVVICTKNSGAPNMMRLLLHELYVHACNPGPTGTRVPHGPGEWGEGRRDEVIREAQGLGF